VDGPFREVHRRAAVVRLDIERAAFGHVVRDIGDVHSQPEMAVRQPRQRNRVVEIARVLAVDRHYRPIAKVGPALDVAIADVFAETPRFGDRFRSVRIGNLVLVNDDLGIDAGVIRVAQHLGDAADWTASGGRPLGDLDDHHVVLLSVARLASRDPDVGRHPFVEGHDPRQPGGLEIEPAHDRRGSALQHLENAPLGPAVGPLPLHSNDDAIAVHGAAELVGGHDDVACDALERLLRRHEPEPRRGRLEPPRHLVHPLGETVAVAAKASEGAVGRQAAQLALERVAIFATNPQHADQLARGRRMRDLSPHLPE
jgi:hypothetical protein